MVRKFYTRRLGVVKLPLIDVFSCVKDEKGRKMWVGTLDGVEVDGMRVLLGTSTCIIILTKDRKAR